MGMMWTFAVESAGRAHMERRAELLERDAAAEPPQRGEPPL
jgi:hypothetical protein